MVNSINTNIAAYYAQANISAASSQASKSVARLSSGNRIVNASDDVAGLSIGTSLQTSVSTLKIALTNASQGGTLLQIADGALSQITEILQRQKAIALQAGSGSLTDTDRGFLNQEFQALQQEIDRLSGSTTFNGVKLINGSLANSSSVTDNTAAADAGKFSLTFLDDIIAGETVKFIAGGTTITLAANASPSGLQFGIGSTRADTVRILAARLNQIATDNSLVDGTNITQAQQLALSGVVFSAEGDTLKIASRAGGSLGNSFVVDLSGTATNSGEATLSGSGYGNVTSFNLFSVTTGLSSTSTVISATTAAASTPFQNGDSITATGNDGVSKTLFTLTAGAGTGASGNYTLQDIVNGINSNKTTTGYSAALVYDSATSTYNLRLSTGGVASNVLISAGTNYHGGTYDLNGQGLTTAGNLALASGASKNQALFYTKYVDVITVAGFGAAITTGVTSATSTSTAATPFTAGDNLTITINGEQQVLYTFSTAGGSDGLDDIVAGINANAIAGHIGVRAVITGSTGAYNLRLYMTDPGATYSAISAGANLGSGVTLNTTSAATGATLSQTVNTSLGGASDNGLAQGNVSISGSIGNSILQALSQVKANSALILTQNASAGTTLAIGGHTFTFTSNSTRGVDEILIGGSIADTIDNIISTVNSYLNKGYALGTEAYQLNQLNLTRNGNTLQITGKGLGNITTLAGGNSTLATTVTGASLTVSTLNNAASTYGVNATGITNADFQGTIQGFSATLNTSSVATNHVNLSIKVGKFTYTAQNVNAAVTSDTRIRFYSDTVGGDTGGYFDIQLQAGAVTSFSDQAGADAVASRLNVAFSSLSFNQSHNLSSYNGTQGISAAGTVIGSLVGSKVSAQLSDFTNVRLNDVKVSAPSGSQTDATITLVINGVNYKTATGIGTKLGANQTYRLVSEDDPNQFVSFTTGDTSITIDTAEKANAVRDALRSAFGADEGTASLSFQVGATASDTLAVSIGDARTSNLYQGATLDVLSQINAAVASAALDTALQTLTSLRANVGALQSRFNFASASIQSSVQNQDAARAALLDTDIASESTSYATSQVKLQAGISVLAQANQQLQALLKLIG